MARSFLIDRVNEMIACENITPKDLESILKVNQSTVSRLLKGKISANGKSYKRLENWLNLQEVSADDQALLKLLKSTIGSSSEKKKAIMQIMHIVSKNWQ